MRRRRRRRSGRGDVRAAAHERVAEHGDHPAHALCLRRPGLLRYTVDNAGYVSSLAYNYAGKHTSTIVYAAPIAPATSDFTYDNIKALVSPPSGIANPANDRQSYSVYNAKGEVAYTIGAAGTVTGYTYDIAGNVIKTVRYAAVRATTARCRCWRRWTHGRRARRRMPTMSSREAGIRRAATCASASMAKAIAPNMSMTPMAIC